VDQDRADEDKAGKGKLVQDEVDKNNRLKTHRDFSVFR